MSSYKSPDRLQLRLSLAPYCPATGSRLKHDEVLDESSTSWSPRSVWPKTNASKSVLFPAPDPHHVATDHGDYENEEDFNGCDTVHMQRTLPTVQKNPWTCTDIDVANSPDISNPLLSLELQIGQAKLSPVPPCTCRVTSSSTGESSKHGGPNPEQSTADHKQLQRSSISSAAPVLLTSRNYGALTDVPSLGNAMSLRKMSIAESALETKSSTAGISYSRTKSKRFKSPSDQECIAQHNQKSFSEPRSYHYIRHPLAAGVDLDALKSGASAQNRYLHPINHFITTTPLYGSAKISCVRRPLQRQFNVGVDHISRNPRSVLSSIRRLLYVPLAKDHQLTGFVSGPLDANLAKEEARFHHNALEDEEAAGAAVDRNSIDYVQLPGTQKRTKCNRTILNSARPSCTHEGQVHCCDKNLSCDLETGPGTHRWPAEAAVSRQLHGLDEAATSSRTHIASQYFVRHLPYIPQASTSCTKHIVGRFNLGLVKPKDVVPTIQPSIHIAANIHEKLLVDYLITKKQSKTGHPLDKVVANANAYERHPWHYHWGPTQESLYFCCITKYSRRGNMTRDRTSREGGRWKQQGTVQPIFGSSTSELASENKPVVASKTYLSYIPRGSYHKITSYSSCTFMNDNMYLAHKYDNHDDQGLVSTDPPMLNMNQSTNYRVKHRHRMIEIALETDLQAEKESLKLKLLPKPFLVMCIMRKSSS